MHGSCRKNKIRFSGNDKGLYILQKTEDGHFQVTQVEDFAKR